MAMAMERKTTVKEAMSEDIDAVESLLKGNHIEDVFGRWRAQIVGPDSREARRKDKKH